MIRNKRLPRNSTSDEDASEVVQTSQPIPSAPSRRAVEPLPTIGPRPLRPEDDMAANPDDDAYFDPNDGKFKSKRPTTPPVQAPARYWE